MRQIFCIYSYNWKFPREEGQISPAFEKPSQALANPLAEHNTLLMNRSLIALIVNIRLD